MKRILVCGGRTYNNEAFLFSVLDRALLDFGSICIIQGGAKGADLLSKKWAKLHEIACFQCDANWDCYDNKAGSIRNQWMLEFARPDMILAFPGGAGTADMVRRGKAAKVETYCL